MQTNTSDEWLKRVPELWGEVHRWALTANLQKEPHRWLARFATRIGCGECREHWEAYLAEFPPDFSSNEALFAWTVAAHNAVNRRLGKPEMTVEAARAYWTTRKAQPIKSGSAAPCIPCREKAESRKRSGGGIPN